MKNAPDRSAIESALDQRSDYTRRHRPADSVPPVVTAMRASNHAQERRATHRIARLIPAFAPSEQRAAVTLLLVVLLRNLRRGDPWN